MSKNNRETFEQIQGQPAYNKQDSLRNNDRLGSIMKGLEKEQREAQAMLNDIEEDNEGRAELEEEIRKFEKWVEKVQPLLTDPTYVPTYEEQRLVVRILGVRAIVFPSIGD